MELTERKMVADFLLEAAAQKWNWVAFDMDMDEPVFHDYASASEAEEFCSAANNQFDYGEQYFLDTNYAFLPIANLAASFEQKPDAREIELIEISRQLADLNVRLQPGWKVSDLEPFLQKDLFFPVQWQQVIEPGKEVKRFLVIEHTHPGHQIYEIGHQVAVLKYFDDQQEGLHFLREKGKELLAHEGTADLILAGEYHGHLSKLNLEGLPEQHCGLAFFTLHCDKHGAISTDTPHQLNRPITIKQTLYAQFGENRGTIRLHDDRLKRTDPRLLATSTYPTHFIKEILTTKNINNMNQDSFEYNKNQLINLGFGPEISEQLLTKMDQNLAGFTLEHTRQFGKDEMQSVLHFSKGDDLEKDLTFFNRYDTTLKKEGMEDLTQTFFVGKAYNYTLQERYNMMDGRAVYREQPVLRPAEENDTIKMKPTGDTYFGWRALDFKNADSYGNFTPKTLFWKHQQEVDKYPIKGIEDNYEKSRIVSKLQKGNYVDVTLVRDGREQQAKMVANPKMVRFDFYDDKGQSLVVRKVEKKALADTQKAGMTPQEVQRAAIAKATEHVQVSGQTQHIGAEQNAKSKQSEDPEQHQVEGQRRKTGIRI